MESKVWGVEKSRRDFFVLFLCRFHFLVKTWCLYVSSLTSYLHITSIQSLENVHHEEIISLYTRVSWPTSLCLFYIYKYSIFNYLLDFLSVPESVSAKHESVDKLRNILEASAPAQGGGLSYKSWRGRGKICLSFLLWWFDPNARLCRLQSPNVLTTPTFTCSLINSIYLHIPFFWSHRAVKSQKCPSLRYKEGNWVKEGEMLSDGKHPPTSHISKNTCSQQLAPFCWSYQSLQSLSSLFLSQTSFSTASDLVFDSSSPPSCPTLPQTSRSSMAASVARRPRSTWSWPAWEMASSSCASASAAWAATSCPWFGTWSYTITPLKNSSTAHTASQVGSLTADLLSSVSITAKTPMDSCAPWENLACDWLTCKSRRASLTAWGIICSGNMCGRLGTWR